MFNRSYSYVTKIAFVVSVAILSWLFVDSPDIQAFQSPLDLSVMDQFYSSHPVSVSERSTPFTDIYGERIARQEIIIRPHHESMLMNVKDTRSTAFMSPLSMPYKTYLPVISTPSRSKTVYSAVYMGQVPNTKYGGGRPVEQSFELRDSLTRASSFHGYSNPGSSPSVSYTIYQNNVVVYSVYPPARPNGYLDLLSIYTQNDLCAKVAAGQVDEVWLWVDGGHMYSPVEFTVNGPTYSIGVEALLAPNCGKTVTTMLLNYDTPTGKAIHSYAHTFDVFLLSSFVPYGYEMCDFSVANVGYWGNPVGQCSGQYAASDVYGFVAAPSPQYNGSVGVCGDTHFPPNLPYGHPNEYDYSSQLSSNSRCMDWQWGGGTVSSVNCSTWGCESCPPYNIHDPAFLRCNERNEAKFLVWWMQNIPGLQNNSHDRFGNIRPNYWDIKFR